MGYKNLKIDGLAIFSFTCLIIYMDPSAGLHTLMAYVSPFENPRKMNGSRFVKNGVSCLLVLEGVNKIEMDQKLQSSYKLYK